MKSTGRSVLTFQLLATIPLIIVLLVFTSGQPAQTLIVFFTRPFTSLWFFGNMLAMAALYMTAATGAALSMRSGTFNLGGEAQLYAPALVTAVLLAHPAMASVPPAVALPLALFAAVLAGALLGLIPGLLRSLRGTSELLTSFLLSAAMVPLVDYLIAGPLRDTSRNLLATAPIPQPFRLPSLLPPSVLGASLPAALLIVACAWFFLERTGPGYAMRMSGTAPDFAQASGLPVRRVLSCAMAAAGAFHGLAGALAVISIWHVCHSGLTSGMGWGALSVALIARSRLPRIIPAALLYAWLQEAMSAAVLTTRFSFDPAPLIQAMIFLVISVQYLPFEKKGGSR